MFPRQSPRCPTTEPTAQKLGTVGIPYIQHQGTHGFGLLGVVTGACPGTRSAPGPADHTDDGMEMAREATSGTLSPCGAVCDCRQHPAGQELRCDGCSILGAALPVRKYAAASTGSIIHIPSSHLSCAGIHDGKLLNGRRAFGAMGGRRWNPIMSRCKCHAARRHQPPQKTGFASQQRCLCRPRRSHSQSLHKARM